jgi:hypothetical protein
MQSLLISEYPRRFKLRIQFIFLGILYVLSFSGCRSQYYGMKDELDQKDLVYIAIINNDPDTNLVTQYVQVALFASGIRPYLEGGGGGMDVSVRKGCVKEAVNAIADDPILKGRGVHIRERFLPLVKDKSNLSYPVPW